MRLRDGRDRFLLASAVAAALLTAVGCSAQASQTAGVATSFGVTIVPVPSSASAALATPSANGQSGSDAGEATACPLPSSQLFVEGKNAAVKDGQISFSYLDAERICAGDESARFVAIGTTVTTKPVSPSAVVLLLAPNGGSDELQVPVPALPAAMASDKAATFYAITVDGAGAITRIEQAYHP